MPLAHVQGNVDRNSFLASKQGLLSVWPFVWPVAHFAEENISTIPALCALQSSRSDLSPCRCQGSRGGGAFAPMAVERVHGRILLFFACLWTCRYTIYVYI